MTYEEAKRANLLHQKMIHDNDDYNDDDDDDELANQHRRKSLNHYLLSTDF